MVFSPISGLAAILLFRGPLFSVRETGARVAGFGEIRHLDEAPAVNVLPRHFI
jgi:hypothetical protein